MKKLQNILMVLTLGVILFACTDNGTVITPSNTLINSTNLAGEWNLDDVDYQGGTYTGCDDISYGLLTDNGDARAITFLRFSKNISGVDIVRVDGCGTGIQAGDYQILDGGKFINIFDSNNTLRYRFEVISSDFSTTPSKLSLKLIDGTDAHSGDFVLGATNNMIRN